LLQELYEQCKDLVLRDELHTVNVVKQIYKSFTNDEITAKIAQLITPKKLPIPVDVIYQTIESLHEACPSNLGDWYFTGNYPTPGGNRVVNKAFMNYVEGRNERGY
jgi:amidophosphoribosyltransferase